ncbi:tRNA lysidine(34) synthetase TilS [Candidatus Saccharibacteria bacterium]|jgi:tRNA(Ile)-lysidine synthase|nr:tRNA lysidine(34) synthetase TilS [Candidatus Saccharibacteria bacterium]
MSNNNSLPTAPLKLWLNSEFMRADSSSAVYVVAVSGGVDSVVLLDLMASWSKKKLIVAHVHHGIRQASDDELLFVERLANDYGLQFESTHLNLGKSTSEMAARQGRYDFLRSVAKRYNGLLVTAHHTDDVIETVALHIQRGTGWRGLAVMGAADIWRPLTWWQKNEIIDYAKSRQLDWREDESNLDYKYARNRLRPLVADLTFDDKQEILNLWHYQRLLAQQIDNEVNRLLTFRRYFYTMAPAAVAHEVLRAKLLEHGVACTRPQIQAALLAIKVARPGAKFSLNNQMFLQFDRINFTVIKR